MSVLSWYRQRICSSWNHHCLVIFLNVMPYSTQNSALNYYYFYSFVFMLFVLDTGYRCIHWDIYGGLLVVQCIKGWWWNWIWFLIVGFLDSLEPSDHGWVFMWVQPHVCANKQKTIRQILDEGDTIFWQHKQKTIRQI